MSVVAESLKKERERRRGTRNDDERRTLVLVLVFFFFSSRRRHTRSTRDWSSDVCSSDLHAAAGRRQAHELEIQVVRVVRHRLQLAGPGERETGTDEGRRRTGVKRRSEERRVGKECRCRWWPNH